MIGVPVILTFAARAPSVSATGIPPMLTNASELATLTVLPPNPLKAISAPVMLTIEPPATESNTPLLMVSVLPLARLTRLPPA